MLTKVLATVACGSVLSAGVSGAEPLAMRGADISALAALEKHGAVYRDDGEPADAVELFARHGVNWFRLRLFVEPNHEGVVVNDLSYTIALAKRVKSAGGKLLLDFHYADTWADPGKQPKPAAWKGLDFDALAQRVRGYTRNTMQAMKAEGVLPEAVQIGNEITGGMLWPDGKLWVDKTKTGEEFDRLATLLKAGIAGAREGAGDAPLEVMVHIARGDRWEESRFYFERLAERGVEFDLIGYSYYPRFHGTLAEVRENLANTVNTFRKPVVLVELGYASRNGEFEEGTKEFPVTPEGQKAFLDAVIDAVRELPDGMGRGVFWWYPEAVKLDAPGLVWCDGRLGLFDESGNALPALDAFAEAAR